MTYVDGGLRVFLQWACGGGANSSRKIPVGFRWILSGLCEGCLLDFLRIEEGRTSQRVSWYCETDSCCSVWFC